MLGGVGNPSAEQHANRLITDQYTAQRLVKAQTIETRAGGSLELNSSREEKL
jgi:hypothetical protein